VFKDGKGKARHDDAQKKEEDIKAREGVVGREKQAL
jgi:hypothetical protein